MKRSVQGLCGSAIPPRPCSRFLVWIIILVSGILWSVSLHAQSPGATANEIRILEIQGVVEIMPVGAKNWLLTPTNQVLHPGDKLRTGDNSRTTVRWTDQSVVPFGPLTELEILAPETPDSLSGLHLLRGIAFFFHRDKPGRIRVLTHGANASVEGTEFVIEAAGTEGEQSRLSVIDGKVRWENAQGTIVLTNNQQAEIEPGQAPRQTAGLVANNLLQWCFYYPAILDLKDLPLSSNEISELRKSLDGYRQGDLLAALANYDGSNAASDAVRVYHASLLLSVGQVERAESELSQISSREPGARTERLATALRTLIAAVKGGLNPSRLPPQLASEFLAASYYEQSVVDRTTSLERALELAKEAARLSPDFGFAQERVAELEFGFGHTSSAQEALKLSLHQSPRNAQALALQGFILAAQNKIEPAISYFNSALAVDAALGNAWLGRGLCRIHQGDARGGREDLLMAAAVEPQRALLRAYLGKAYADTGDNAHATRELGLAIRLDPGDPTGWLYLALVNQQQNRINESVRDLEKSQELNDNRSVFRSGLLLDQDNAVRSANLAAIYLDDGMPDVSVREATRAVNYDYANYSAHLFLANSYNQLRDPQQVDLRYETPWLSEYLLANLLAPVGANSLSQLVSQQEYSRLFEHDQLGFASSTEYLSRSAWNEYGSQYGYYKNFGYSMDATYRSDDGQRPNEDVTQLTLSLELKYDLTPNDSLYFQGIYYHANSGDLTPYFDQASAHLGLRVTEKEQPITIAGFRHEWAPGVQTLFLAGRFTDSYSTTDTNDPVLLLAKDSTGSVIAVPTPGLPTASLSYHDYLTLYSGEVQQIFQTEKATLIVGTRIQSGSFNTSASLGQSTATLIGNQTTTSILPFSSPPISQSQHTDFNRETAYGYFLLQLLDELQGVGGVSYDAITYPLNIRSAPISTAQNSDSQVSPKAGLVWTPARNTVVRFAYTRSLGGVAFDQSVRLEPVQVAGFTQAFRSLIPESVAGSLAAEHFETYGLALEQKFDCGLYLGLEGQLLKSHADRLVGSVDLDFPPAFVPSSTKQHFNYDEQNIIATANQLIADWWSIGLRYSLSRADLEAIYPQIPASVTSAHDSKDIATLHQLSLFGLFNHPSGWYARAEGNLYAQQNGGDESILNNDTFWQINALAGYRFWHRRAQLQLGILNLLDQDYHLNPLNVLTELPRHRTLTTSLQLTF